MTDPKQRKVTREELIKLHCENQDCSGCPAEFECDEASINADSDQNWSGDDDDFDPTPW